MRSPSHPLFIFLIVVTTAASPMLAGAFAAGKVHMVGGREHWALGVNYTLWASGEHFYTGDLLAFHYEKGMHNVVQVSASDYERCATDHPISSWSAGRSYLTQLKAAGRYYYICSRGNFCNAGMKIAVVVAQRPAPAHSRFESSAESYSRRSGGAAVLVGSMVAGSVAWGICAAGSLL